jgi:hypothetical protein
VGKSKIEHRRGDRLGVDVIGDETRPFQGQESTRVLSWIHPAKQIPRVVIGRCRYSTRTGVIPI